MRGDTPAEGRFPIRATPVLIATYCNVCGKLWAIWEPESEYIREPGVSRSEQPCSRTCALASDRSRP
jgi:hypothetical protein